MSDEPGPSSYGSRNSDSELSSISSRRQQSHRRVKLTTNLQFDATQDAFDDIRRLLELFYEFAIPGPLLLRTGTDFSLCVGSGGQGQVRAASPEYISALQSLDEVGTYNGSTWSTSTDQQQCISFWKNCVIKKLRSKKGKLEAEAQSAVREVYSLCQASKSVQTHQHVVRLLGWGLCLDALESGDLARSALPFLILERALCDMAQFIDERKHAGMEVSTRIRMAMDIGLGIQAIHTAGMTHGDLKPSNILIFPSGKQDWSVKICDFGSASNDVGRKIRSHYTGTDTWRPPETYSDSQLVDLQACDIFAYGLVIWAWLTGRDASPIESLDGSQILINLGQQQFYRRALFDVVKDHGYPSDRAWLDNESIFCPHFHNTEQGGRKPKRSPFFCGWCFSLEIREGSDGLTRDFESPTINPVMNALSIALDEIPSRRKRQPWDFLKSGVLVKIPLPPQPAPRLRAKNDLNDDTASAAQNKGHGIVRFLKYPISISMKPTLQNHLKSSLFQLEHFVFILVRATSSNTFRRFDRIFDTVPGWGSNRIDFIRHADHDDCARLSQLRINALKTLIARISHGGFVKQPLLTTMRFALRQQDQIPDQDWDESVVYALSRIRSRFTDDVCWNTLFVLDRHLADTIDRSLAKARRNSCKMTLAWTLRNTSALYIPVELHMEYFAFLLTNAAISDEDLTFRMHLLLERGFFLGQKIGDNGPWGSRTAFGFYLHKLRNEKCAIQICQHFQRIASLDGVDDSARFYYTGYKNGSEPEIEDDYMTTCLHDAVQALNPFVTEFLLKTNFNASTMTNGIKTVNDLLNQGVALESTNLDHMQFAGIKDKSSRQRKAEIALMFLKLETSKHRSSDLPLGWEVWRAGSSQAFVETSTDLAIDAKTQGANESFYPYPITFKKPSTGLYQASAIALVERHISDTQKEPYLFNPQRFLRSQGQIDSGQEPARTPHFDENWYQTEALAHTRFSDDTQNFQELWGDFTYAVKRRTRKTIARLSDKTYVKSFTKFLLSGDLVIVTLTPLSLVARYCGWDVQTQLFLSVFALSGVYAHLWHTLDSTKIFEPIEFARPWLRLGDAKLDQIYNYGIMLLDFVLALLFAYRTHFDFACAFVIGSILLQNLLVLGLASISAGRFSFRFDVDSHAGRPARNFTAFPFFVAAISYALRSTSSTYDSSKTSPSLFISRAAAVIAILLSIAFHSYRQPKRPPVVNADGKEVIIERTTQRGLSFGQTHDSSTQTALFFVIVIVLCVVVGDNVAVSISALYGSNVVANLSLGPGFATLVLVPLISKFLIIFKLVALGNINEIQTVVMRTVGLSLDHGLVVLPLLVITSWCFGGKGDNVIPAGLIVFLFIQWRLLTLTVYQNASDWHWFKALPSIGAYIIFALYAFVEPLH